MNTKERLSKKISNIKDDAILEEVMGIVELGLTPTEGKKRNNTDSSNY